jgi:Nucleotidyltransferase domain
MRRQLEYPPVTEALLAEVVRRIVSVGDPFRIVLFGSRAKGETRPDSDLDLLIIEESDLPRYKRPAQLPASADRTFPGEGRGCLDGGRGKGMGGSPQRVHNDGVERRNNPL